MDKGHIAFINPVIARDGIMIKNHVPMNLKRAEFFEDLNNVWVLKD